MLCVSSCIPSNAILQPDACALFDQSTSLHEVLQGLQRLCSDDDMDSRVCKQLQRRDISNGGPCWRLTLASERPIALLNHEDLLALI